MGLHFTFTDHSREYLDLLEKALEKAFDRAGQVAVDKIHDQMLNGYHDPHGPDGHTQILDTGRLFDSIQYGVTQTSGRANSYTLSFGTDGTAVNQSGKPYAIYVHDGTSKLKGRPFIRDAVNKNPASFKAAFEETLKNA